MLRRFVAIYLVLVLLAGPGLCCCTLAHAVAGPSTPQAAPAEPPPACPCCQPGAAPTHDAAPAHDTPPRPDCPCRHWLTQPATVAEPAPGPVAAGPSACFHFPSPSAPAADLSSRHGVHSPPGASPPFLTADDLLHAHHQLRC